MNYNFLLFCLVVISFHAKAQTDSSSTKDNFSYNHFTIRGQNGFGKANFENITGNERPKGGLILQPIINAEYTVNFKPSFGINLGTGIGVHIYSQQIYYKIYAARLLLDLSISPEYRIPLKTNFLTLSAGLGLNISGNNYSGFSESDADGNYAITELAYANVFRPYVKSRVAYGLQLKNRDFLSFNFDLQYSFTDVFNGDFTINNGQQISTGTIRNSGSLASIGIGYTFSMIKKNEQLRKISETSNLSKSQSKKELKKEWRYFHPKTTMIGGFFGSFMNVNKADDPGKVFVNASSPSWNAGVSIEQGWKKNIYFQGGFAVSSYWSWMRHEKYSDGASGSNAFLGYSINTGIMKRFDQKNNRNLINIAAGLNVVVQPEQKGTYSFGATELSDTSSLFLTYYYVVEVKRNVFPAIYIGIGKDFHLTKNLLFTLNYRYQFGLISVMDTEITYNEASDLNNKNATIRIDGSAHSVNFGLKYRFLLKKFRE